MDLLLKKVASTKETKELNTKTKLDFKSKTTSFKTLVNIARLTNGSGGIELN